MTYRPNLPPPTATTAKSGAVKPDGVSVTAAVDGTLTVVTAAFEALNPLATAVGGAKLTAGLPVHQDGVDYSLTLAAAGPLLGIVPATTAQRGLVKPDGTSLIAAADGTLSVVTVSTNQLPPGVVATPTDTIAAYSSSSGSDVGYSVRQVSAVVASLRGIQRIGLKTAYGARCDGTSHPLAGLYASLAAATTAFPNIGLTAATWSTVELDTAAFLQCEYDLRTGTSGAGIIGLDDGAGMMVSLQLNMQDASRVWFHGGRRSTLYAAACGTTPVIRLANCPNVGLPLADLEVLAQPTGVGASTSGAGVAHTGFAPGSSFLQLDSVEGIDIERVGWNGFDKPIVWGNHIYGIRFRQCGGSGCNIGFNWNQTVGLDSMERIYFEGGALDNNNYGFYLDATYGPGKTSSQGGSLFIQDSAIDYNIVRQGVYLGNPMTTANPPGVNSYGGNSLHITRCHIETTGACSGASLSRILSQGTLMMSENEIYENDANVPVGYVEVADNTSCSMVNNRVNNRVISLMYSSSAGLKRVSAHGNVMQDSTANITMLTDARGPRMQPVFDDGDSVIVFGDPNPMLAIYYSGKPDIICDYANPSTFTLDSAGYPIGYTFRLWCAQAAVTLAVLSGTTLTTFPAGATRLTTPGTCALVRRHSLTEWVVTGPLVT